MTTVNGQNLFVGFDEIVFLTHEIIVNEQNLFVGFDKIVKFNTQKKLHLHFGYLAMKLP